MQVIDFDKKGNVIRLYYGADNEKDYWGDDWDDRPYEHKADPVYGEYVKEFADFAFPFDMEVMEPADDRFYGENSPFSKEDFKQRKTPCLVVVKDTDDWNICYHKYMGADSDNVLRIYFEDDSDDTTKKITSFGGVILPVENKEEV